MRKQLREKWNRRGISLAETLVTVLLLSIVLSAVTAGAATSLRLYREIRKKADAQTLLSTAIMAVSENLYYSRDDQNGAFYSETAKGWVTYTNEDTGDGTGRTELTCTVRSTAPGTAAESGKESGTDPSSSYRVLNSGSEPLGLYAVLGEAGESTPLISYEDGVYTFTVRVLDEDGKELESQVVKVRTALWYADSRTNAGKTG